MAKEAEYKLIEVTAGSQPNTDFTEASTPHYVETDKIRFVDGYPEKIGGWKSLVFNNNNQVGGCCRTIYSYTLNRNTRYIFGTHTRLYYRIGATLRNITPLNTTTQAIADSLDTNYGTLSSNPITTVLGSTTITVTDTSTKVRVGDTIELSGSAAVNGVPAGEINTTHFVRTHDANSYTFITATAATSSGSGGGGSVVQATPIITVNKTAHALPNGDRVKITGSSAAGGIPALSINLEFVIRNVQTNSFDILTDTVATSSVTGGGGAGVEIQQQIDQGLCDATSAQGYGAGLYGVGLYGTALTSTSGSIPVRSWVFDRYGNNVIGTAGDQTEIYTWDSDTAESPILLSNAPTAVNYVFVSNEIVVTLGANGVPSRIKWSDQGVSTQWVSLATNQAGEDDKEGASEFISHINVKGVNLLFTDSQVYTFRYIGRPFIWEIKQLDEKSGIIAKNARVQHNGVAYWMGSDNFYYYKSGNVEIIPSNTTNETTLKKYIFDDLNLSQISKIFAWYNRKFNEVWWHIPSADSQEPNRIVRYNIKDSTFTYDNIERSAGEYPTQLKEFPIVAKVDNNTSTIYEHENGVDDDGSSLPFLLKTRRIFSGTNVANINGIMYDNRLSGSLTVTIDGYEFAQSTNKYTTTTLTMDNTTGHSSIRVQGRYIQYIISGDELGQSWRSGDWFHLVGKGGTI